MKIFGLTAVTGRIRALIASRQATSRYLHFSSLPSIQHHYGGTQVRALPVLIGSLNPRITRFPCVPNLSRLIATETSGAETKLPLFPLFINGGKNSGLVFLSSFFFLSGGTETKTAKWTQSPKSHASALIYQAEPLKTRESPGEKCGRIFRSFQRAR